MIRHSLSRLRLGSLAAAGSQAAAAAAAEGGLGAAWAPQSAAALQLLDRWQQAGQGGGAGRAQQQHSAVRHFSLWPGGSGSSRDKPAAPAPVDSVAAAAEDLGSIDGGSSFAASAAEAAAAAGPVASSPGMSDLFSAAAIVAAASGAEADALMAAREDAWLGSRLVQALLCAVHGATGLPWWQDIMLCTLGMRLATLPVMIAQVKNTYRLSQARPEMEALMEYLKEEQARGNPNAAQEHTARVMAIWRKYKCNPMKSLAGMFVQAPIFIGFFTGLRAMAAAKIPSLTEGGALWFSDLTAADPYFLLPAFAGLSFLATIELGAADGMEGQPEETKKKMKTVMRVVALAVPILSTTIPASVFMYWTASNIFSLVQTSMLKIPGVKRVLGLPDLSKLRAAGSAAGAAAAGAAAGKPVQTFTKPPHLSAHKPRAKPGKAA
ncbi:hypothetical protein ABPG75_012698 [Micractinium tetrahymenae]